MEQIIILGHGGHAKSVVDAIEKQGKYKIAGYIVNGVTTNDIISDYPIIGCDEDLQTIYKNGIHYAAIGIGFLGKSSLRSILYNKLKKNGYDLPVICDPTAIISNKVKIGEGTFIGKGAIINRDASIGKGCIINTGAIVEHECFVGDFSHIAVGAVLCGNVSIGRETLIGANATVIQCRKVGEKCIIGAGEVVRKDILKIV